MAGITLNTLNKPFVYIYPVTIVTTADEIRLYLGNDLELILLSANCASLLSR